MVGSRIGVKRYQEWIVMELMTVDNDSGEGVVMALVMVNNLAQ